MTENKKAIVVRLDADVSRDLGVVARVLSLTKPEMAERMISEALANHELAPALASARAAGL